jgi:hypothetical protein
MSAQTADERVARAARTQCLFRDVNERVKEINDAFSIALPLGDWVCECAADECVERLALSQTEYETVRANPRRFLVMSNKRHVVDGIEDVVHRDERFWVVEKKGQAGELAAAADPRTVGLRGRNVDAAVV